MAILLPDRIDVTTFGEFLRDARERRGLTLQQIASETRIPWRHLDALEHGNLDAVPSGVYRRAEIRAYADAVGLDRSLALTQFEQALESSAAPAVASKAPPSGEGRARMTWTAIGTIGVVAAATMFAISLWKGDRPASAGTAVAAVAASVAQPTTPAEEPVPPTLLPDPVKPVAAPVARVAPTVVASAGPVPRVVPAAPVVLTITSEPAGARVLVNGLGRGATPLTVDHLTAGTTRVRVIKDGYVSQERAVTVGERPITVHVRLDAVH